MSKFKIHVQHISYGWCGLEFVIGDKLIKCNAGYSGPNPLASLIEICLDFLTSQKEGVTTQHPYGKLFVNKA